MKGRSERVACSAMLVLLSALAACGQDDSPSGGPGAVGGGIENGGGTQSGGAGAPSGTSSAGAGGGAGMGGTGQRTLAAGGSQGSAGAGGAAGSAGFGVGGASITRDAGAVGGADSSVGSTVDGGQSNASGVSQQGYDGARGQSFDDGWTFHLGDVPGAEQPTFSDDAWTRLSVPHDWSPPLGMSQSSAGRDGEGYSIGGIGWYRRSFTLDAADTGKNIFVEFDGVYYNSEVWINGTSLGTWPYGYTTFQYELTKYVKTDGSENVLAVRVDNKQPSSRWYTGSGIYRNVWLTTLNPVHIAFNGAFITTPTVSASSATVSVATEVENRATTAEFVTAATSLYDASGNLAASGTSSVTSIDANGKATLTQTLTVSSPKLWSVDSPELYQAKIELRVGGQPVDTYTSSLGIRSLKFDADTGFSLNDKAMKIWGVCLHHDLGALGSAVNVRAMERQLQIMKAMGANGIRTSHNPPAPELLDLADRMGFLVMDESFDVWETGKNGLNDYHLYFNEWAQKDLQAEVRRDRNHPSVIMWSIGNEIAGATQATGIKLRDWVKAYDTTRPVTWAANRMGSDQGQRDVAAVLDLQGYNYFVGDANTDNGSLVIDRDHKANPTWRIFGSEELSNVKSRGVYYTSDTQSTDLHWTGCKDPPKQCSSYDVGWGDGFNTEEMYLISTKRSYFAGQFDWTGFDYGGEPTPYGWPSKSSYFGLVDTAGFPKDIYYFYQSKLTTEPMVHILPHWNWSAGANVWVWVYSNCDSVELFLNGTSLGSKSYTSDQTTRLEWSVPWSAGTLRAEGKRGGGACAVAEVKTAGAPSALRLSPDRSEIKANGKDLAFIEADVIDSSATSVPTAQDSISFSVSGPGRLEGVDNGDATDTTSYTSSTRKAFSGKALAIVRSTGTTGAIVVTATATGLASGSVTVTAN